MKSSGYMNMTAAFFKWFRGLGVAALLSVGTLSLSAAEIIAHRGASFDAPENTLASVMLAWEQGADAVEIDIYLSKDQRIVAMHDRTPKRYGGPDRPVVDMTWDEIRELDVGKWKSEKYEGEKVPEFDEILLSVPQGKRLFIEVKCGPEIVPVLAAALKKSGRPASEHCVICFNSDVIREVTAVLPELQRYWLLSMEQGKEKMPPALDFIIENSREIGATGVNLGGKTSLIGEDLLVGLSQAGIPCYAWTVNDPDEAIRLVKLGVKGITTDKPGALREFGVPDVVVE
ncbi:glycerophosphodiester phosphodiesterase [Planctomicrobium sp. SH668]|uniref:glycerophosphodiester phosphodiesterase n=1 Tax=Planctomicrobium sp. SH668 TaxID=3448126 RepID=UPI003F5C8A89